MRYTLRLLTLDQLGRAAGLICALELEREADKLRERERSAFVPGRFVCPHGACFDHKGNIFVVEWVEVGRVTKLQKVS